MTGEQASRRENIAFWCIVFAVFLLTRLPAMNQYLSIDNVNLAFALEKFDPRIHQPQPPGYPLFVFLARIINVIFHDAEKTFAFISIGVSALCLPLAFSIGRRVFAPWVGQAAVLLLLVSPPFWYGTSEGPLRPCLALFSLLTAYCCWRCWNGEKVFMFWGAIALGVGSGVRPDLGAYLFPLWLLSAWMGTRSIAAVLRGIAVMTGVVLCWLGGMAYAVDGFGNLYRLNMEYVVNQSQGESILMGAAERGWMRQLSRLAVWNGTSVFAALFGLPWILKARERWSLRSVPSVFMIVWLLPGLLFQALVHVADPGHTLFSIPAMCILGAALIYAAASRMEGVRDGLLAASLIFGLTVFLALYPLPAAGEPAGGLHSLKNAFVFGAFETSIGELRYIDNTAKQTMAEMKEFMRTDRPTIIVSSDTDTVNWFTNWRIVRYYVPDLDIWVIADLETPHRVEHVRRDKTFESGVNLKIPVPAGGRVIWLTEREGPFHRALKQAFPHLAGGNYLSYTDIAPETQPFRVADFDFVPSRNPGQRGYFPISPKIH